MKAMEREELNLVTLAQQYADEGKARELLESLRWPNGARCPHCGGEHVYRLRPKAESKAPCRPGLWKCGGCRKQFTVRVGTIFEDSHIPLSKWVMAIFIMCSAKKGISAKQLERMLGMTYKTAWFMAHRIRYAMTEGPMAGKLSGVVEVDETYIGGKSRLGIRGRGSERKTPVVVLVERAGFAKTQVVKRVTSKTLHAAIKENVEASAALMTDDFASYRGIGRHFRGGHTVVNHSAKEYARGAAHTNTAESFFSLLKRGVYGSFHHVSRKHLHRYAHEFAFRWNLRHVTDGERAEVAVAGFEGKRLMYRDSLEGS